MFQALLKAGVPREKLDGIPTKDMWQLYRDQVKNAKTRKVTLADNQSSNSFSVVPTAPPAGSPSLYLLDELARLK